MRVGEFYQLALAAVRAYLAEVFFKGAERRHRREGQGPVPGGPENLWRIIIRYPFRNVSFGFQTWIHRPHFQHSLDCIRIHLALLLGLRVI